MTLAEKLAKRIENKPPMTVKEMMDKLVEDGLIVVTDERRITGMFGQQRNIYGETKE